MDKTTYTDPSGYDPTTVSDATDQLRECMGGSRSACSVALVTVADDPVSAHALAAKLVADYQAEHQACPAGQWVSCTR